MDGIEYVVIQCWEGEQTGMTDEETLKGMTEENLFKSVTGMDTEDKVQAFILWVLYKQGQMSMEDTKYHVGKLIDRYNEWVMACDSKNP